MQSLQTVWASQLVKLFAISACQIVWCVRVLNRMLWCASNSLSNSVSYSPGTYSSKLSVILSAITVWQTLWSANSLANYISVSKTVWQTVHALENSLADSTRSRKQFGKQYTLCKQFGKLFAVFFGSAETECTFHTGPTRNGCSAAEHGSMRRELGSRMERGALHAADQVAASLTFTRPSSGRGWLAYP